LVNRDGRRFMPEYDSRGELAPRDIVSRVIHDHLVSARAPCIYLDVRHIAGFGERFPNIARLCAEFGIDVRKDLIPVRPSAHYLVGGVETALDGSTSVEGLLCCGEAASTGVHGANRMASNSLLEGLVFGRLAGETAGQRASANTQPAIVRRLRNDNPPSPRTALDLPDVVSSLRSLMWRNVGIVRRGDRLEETCDILNFWGHYTLDKTFNEPSGWELQNQLMVGRLVTMSALARTQSLGVHYRADAQASQDPTLLHVSITRDSAGTKAKCVDHASSPSAR
jgi:L-aspartate oxidase